MKYYEIVCSVGVIGVCSEDVLLHNATEDDVKSFGEITKEQLFMCYEYIFDAMQIAADFKKTMDDLGMKIVSAHCDHIKDFERKAAEAGEIGMKYLICPWVGPQKSIDDFKKFADQFNHCGEIAKKNGIRFAYHNHDYSFAAMNGIVPQDVMIQSTNPATVDFEMDMYWTVAAGVDPIAYMKKFPNRFKLVHVKDMAKTAKGHESCVVGKGTIDYKNILPQAHQQGVNYFIVEQEEYTGTNELDAAKADASYLKTLNW